MAATTQTSQPQQPKSEPQPKNTQKTFWTDNEGNTQLEALAAVNDCSQGAVLRKLVDDAFTEQFDNLDPAHIEQGHVSVDDLRALANGETTVDELDLQAKTSEPVDGYDADSYYLTVTPDDLAEPGPELDWATLRDAVKNPEDGGYWNDDLEIHESRVGENTLKASHRPAARILTGLARSQAYENGVIPQMTVDDLVDTYCLHLTDRVADAEQERGKEHIRETYTSLVTDQLYENPSPTADSYYCSTDHLQTRLQTEIDTAQSVAERAGTITDFYTWKSTDDADEDDETNNLREEWQRELARWLTDIARAKHAGRTYGTELRRGDYEIDDADESMTAFDAVHARLHDALEAVDDLPTNVKAELIDRLDDAVVTAIAGD
ncbi:hypothetical protein [Halomicrococcus sp. NG-SE-24]|uniref:hypothetical protein n=1 Tax=Halomicrococcus sp. NG-SE-24 TaxID=3436928 RepID=UPI003D9A00A3